MEITILLLGAGGVITITLVGYFLWKDMEEQKEIGVRFQDLEIATRGYCHGELNGAYNRIKQRQKNKNERKNKTRTSEASS